jgi:hypothetical protein
MLKRVASILAWGSAAVFACSGSYYSIRGVEFAPGEYYVLQQSSLIFFPNAASDTVGIQRLSDMKHYFDTSIANSNIAFIGRIDSVIGGTYATGDTIIPAMEPVSRVLKPRFPQDTLHGVIYAHLAIDTLIKGTLPGSQFWFRGYTNGHSCDLTQLALSSQGNPFLNFSATFDKMSDLRVETSETFCSFCPISNMISDGYLFSPVYSVLKLDIHELFPTYLTGGTTGIRAKRPEIRVPLRAPGKSYRPDGRAVPENATRGKNPAPVLK